MLRDEELTYRIRGAVYEVNKVLGPGFLEAVYQNSLAYELRQRGLEVQAEVPVVVNYKGQPVGEHRLLLSGCHQPGRYFLNALRVRLTWLIPVPTS